MATRKRAGKYPKKGEGGERRKRTTYSKDQVEILIKTFKQHRYPSFFLREKLAHLMGIQESRLHVWFQNRRARQPKKPSDSTDAGKSLKVPPHNLCPQDQPREMQSNATAPAPNLVNNASSLAGGNWNLSYHSMQYWQSYQQEASFHCQSSSFGTGLTVPVPQSNSGWDAGTRGMPSGLKGAVNLPMVQQPGQQGTFFRNAQPNMNYLNPEQPVPRSLGEQICTPNFQYPVSPQNLYGMPDATSHLNCNQAVVNEENVNRQASQASSSPVLGRESVVPFADNMSVASSSSLASPSPSVQWQEAAQEEAYPVMLYGHSWQEMTEYDANWLGMGNGLVKNSLEQVSANDQTRQQSEGAGCYFSSTFQH